MLMFFMLIFSIFQSGWQQINLLIAFFVLITTICAAIAAYLSFFVTRSILYYNFLSRYSSPELGKSFEILWELSDIKDKYRESFNKIIDKYKIKSDDLSDVIKKGKKQHITCFDYKYRETQDARRAVSHYFGTAFELYHDFKALKHIFFKKICTRKTFELLYRVVEHLEIALNPEYKPDKFHKILNQSGRTKEEIRRLNEFRLPQFRDDFLKKFPEYL